MIRPSKIETFLQVAEVIAKRSSCDRTQVGAVLTSLDYELVVVGWNGGPKGGINHCRRPTAGSCGCVHAEANAATKAFRGEKLAFLTLAPCEQCAVLLVNTGVREVFFRDDYRLENGLQVLREVGVPFHRVRLEES